MPVAATIEISVSLTEFRNIDLFQRGFYQIKVNAHEEDRGINARGDERVVYVWSCVYACPD